MMEEEAAIMKEASQSDPSIAIQAPASSSSQKMESLRMKGDKYINEDVTAVASKIDILSTAIGKPDYPDAVRGETRGRHALCTQQSEFYAGKTDQVEMKSEEGHLLIPDNGSDVWEIEPKHLKYGNKVASGSFGEL
ncbi:hypothetical protein K1719_012225 [Acacia pycnantha]|nr:hypothetical protein K1719_012225 [Acacia pycnantha]